jgi:hypothetical protein
VARLLGFRRSWVSERGVSRAFFSLIGRWVKPTADPLIYMPSGPIGVPLVQDAQNVNRLKSSGG